MAASDSRASAFAAAVSAAPRTPGVYFMLGAATELLYVGKARDLRRRLQQHDRAAPRPGTRPHDLYQRVREVRWETTVDDATAADREADLVVGLRPPFNASLTGDGRWVFVVVRAAGESAVRFDLADDVGTGAGAARAYGCFPHLGVGVSSARAIACSEGYAAFLRILWAASDAPGHHFPGAIAGSSPPATFTVAVPEARRPALHAFLSGTSRRLLAELDVEVGRRDPFMQPALARDRVSAGAFFTHGPAALRGLRRRHGLPAQPVPRATIEALLAREVRDVIGDFTILELPDPTDGLLGARASKTVSIGATRRAGRGSAAGTGPDGASRTP